MGQTNILKMERQKMEDFKMYSFDIPYFTFCTRAHNDPAISGGGEEDGHS